MKKDIKIKQTENETENAKKRNPRKAFVYEGFFVKDAVWTGLEPATPCVTGMYSNQLNYQTVSFKRSANILVFFTSKNFLKKFTSFFFFLSNT